MSTEAEARDKWCPPSFAIQEERDANGVSVRQGGPWTCMASNCMAWRWSRVRETRAYLAAVQEHMKAAGVDFNKATQVVFAERGVQFEHTEGYCGAFGKPE